MKVTLARSLIGIPKDQRATVNALGLRKTGIGRQPIEFDSSRKILRNIGSDGVEPSQNRLSVRVAL